jgi:hypothetical protein
MDIDYVKRFADLTDRQGRLIDPLADAILNIRHGQKIIYQESESTGHWRRGLSDAAISAVNTCMKLDNVYFLQARSATAGEFVYFVVGK